MREIKFRGKCSQSKRWVYGWLLTNKLGTYIVTEENPHECTQNHYIEIDEYCRVVPETVGQYTGLKDKTGREIYEGDIVTGRDALSEGFSFTGFVDHENGSFVIKSAIVTHYRWLDYILETIGNLHDNPDLLEVTE